MNLKYVECDFGAGVSRGAVERPGTYEQLSSQLIVARSDTGSGEVDQETYLRLLVTEQLRAFNPISWVQIQSDQLFLRLNRSHKVTESVQAMSCSPWRVGVRPLVIPFWPH
jgi:hypothetical protein